MVAEEVEVATDGGGGDGGDRALVMVAEVY